MIYHPNIDPIAIHYPIKIHWYGIMYFFAFIQFYFLGHYRIKNERYITQGFKINDIDDLLTYGVLGVVIGGRLGEIFFYNFNYYLSNPLETLAIWKGGMSFHGGLLGVMISLFLFTKKRNLNFYDVCDFVVPLVPLGYMFGRVGNFINQELPGKIASSDLYWAMKWPNIEYLIHPSPIYQALIDGLLVFIIIFIYSNKKRNRFSVSSLFLILYGVARFTTEYWRVPDYIVEVLNIQLSSGQLLSIPMVIIGFLTYLKNY